MALSTGTAVATDATTRVGCEQLTLGDKVLGRTERSAEKCPGFGIRSKAELSVN